jgi:hypothetical protein
MGDALTIYLAEPTKDRPKEIRRSGRAGHILLVLKRKKV